MLTRLKVKILGWLSVTPKEVVFEKKEVSFDKASVDAFLASKKAPAKKAPAKKAPAKKAPAKKAVK